MGAYLSKPVTDTFPIDEIGTRLSYGASSMQGWRMSQEDAHCCILDYDDDISLFGVFDGHGGAEVAKYTAAHLPDFLKSIKSYQGHDFEKALKDAFVDFDRTLIEEPVRLQLKALADSDGEDAAGAGDEDEDMESNLKELKEEANLPIQDILNRYVAEKLGKSRERKAKLQAQQSISEELAESSSSSTAATSSSSKSGPSSSSKAEATEESADVDAVADTTSTTTPVNGNGTKEEEKEDEEEEKVEVTKEKTVKNGTKAEKNGHDESTKLNGQNLKSDDSVDTKSEEVAIDEAKSESKEVAEGSSSSSGKGRKSKPVKRTSGEEETANKTSTMTLLDLFNKDFDSEDDDDDDSEDDSEDDSNEEECEDDDDDDDDDEDDDDDDDEGDNEDDSEGEEEENNLPFSSQLFKQGGEVPGKDSGCTAVMALLHKNNLFVANAGDSRCVMSRAGKAIEMSFDHKPESEIEFNRIKRAGGWVTNEGRVNGGLNLSRAIGDHSYKENNQLELHEQMITALPDVKQIEITPEDEFLVIACDGIWNSMSSQQAINFVRKRIQSAEKLSTICDQMFHHCLSSNSMGDGTGCDNMTCVIVRFNDHEIQKGDVNIEEDSKMDDNKTSEMSSSSENGSSSSNNKRSLEEDAVEEGDQSNGDDHNAKKVCSRDE